MTKQLEPLNPTERRTAERVQDTANQVISLAFVELRKADDARAISNSVISLITQEMKDYREGSDALATLHEALAALNKAERIMRARGETNGH